MIGFCAAKLTNSSNNVVIGDNAYQTNVSGGSSVVIGASAAISATGGSHVLVGYYAGGNLSSAKNVVAVGYEALYGITTGNNNIGLGYYAGGILNYEIGRLNQSLAYGADSNNIFIGVAAGKQKLSTVLSNSIVIGNNARAYADNQTVLGSVDNTSTYLTGNVEIRNHSILASNSLSEPTFATHTKWTESGDIAYNVNKFTYSHNTGAGSLEQTVANFATVIKPNTWYRVSIIVNYVSGGTGASRTGNINATLNGTVIELNFNTLSGGNTLRYLYYKTGASTGNLKFEFTSTAGTTQLVFDITFAGLEEVIGGDLYVNNDIEQRRGTYQYHRQYFGADTDGDWRTYSDGSGFYTQMRVAGNWVTKETISA